MSVKMISLDPVDYQFLNMYPVEGCHACWVTLQGNLNKETEANCINYDTYRIVLRDLKFRPGNTNLKGCNGTKIRHFIVLHAIISVRPDTESRILCVQS